jgi:hypothetical protein
VKVLSYAGNESGVDNVSGFDEFLFNYDWAHVIYNSVFVFGQHQIRDFTRVEYVVYVFEEGLTQDLVVSHCESCSLLFDVDACGEHQFLYKVSEVLLAETLNNFNLLEVHTVNVTTKLNQRLFARTTDTN